MHPLLAVAAGLLLLGAGYLLGRRGGARTWRAVRRAGGPARVALDSVGLVPGGGLLIVRYRVLAPGRLEVGPEAFGVIDEASGRRFGVLDVAVPGSLAVTEAAREAAGYVLVPNREGAVHSGSLVTVVLGGDTSEHVQVA